jgi:hypothetical protein
VVRAFQPVTYRRPVRTEPPHHQTTDGKRRRRPVCITGRRRSCARSRRSACKPNFVPARSFDRAGGGHFSVAAVASRLASAALAVVAATYPRTGPAGRAPSAVRPGPGLSAYLVLLPVGFAMPSTSPPTRCALTAPFHPYRREGGSGGVSEWRGVGVEEWAGTRPAFSLPLRHPVTPAPRHSLPLPRRSVLCCTFRRLRLALPLGSSAWTLSSTVPCAVRTFLTGPRAARGCPRDAAPARPSRRPPTRAAVYAKRGRCGWTLNAKARSSENTVRRWEDGHSCLSLGTTGSPRAKAR